MEFLKKIKFTHVVLILALYMGINIGLKYYKIYDLIHKSDEISNEVLIGTYEFEDKKFEFYYDESNPYGEVVTKLNGVEMPVNRGFINKTKTKHIYIQQYDNEVIYQNGVKLEPIKTIGSNKIRYVYIYEFDLNSDIKKRDPNVKNDLDITSSLIDGNLTIDIDQLRTMVNTWKLITNESFKHEYEKSNILNIRNTWNPYNFDLINFDNGDHATFNLLKNERIIFQVFHRLDSNSYGNTYYELTEDQYNEFVSLITK